MFFDESFIQTELGSGVLCNLGTVFVQFKEISQLLEISGSAEWLLQNFTSLADGERW